MVESPAKREGIAGRSEAETLNEREEDRESNREICDA
jgi:hypothetical protein